MKWPDFARLGSKIPLSIDVGFEIGMADAKLRELSASNFLDSNTSA
jgi:hypothetical protein